MQEPIDINNPTATIRAQQENTDDPNGVRVSRIYGEVAEMLRLQNAYRPNSNGKYDLNKIMRKRADYELRQLQNALLKQRKIYAEENNINILQLENIISETPEVLETLFQRALDSLPNQCKTIIGNTKSNLQ